MREQPDVDLGPPQPELRPGDDDVADQEVFGAARDGGAGRPDDDRHVDVDQPVVAGVVQVDEVLFRRAVVAADDVEVVPRAEDVARVR